MPDHIIRWGILGPGSISTKFAKGLEAVPDAKISAVGSRNKRRAKAYGSYEALAADPDVDIIYVGTPHSFHKAHTLMCLNAGYLMLDYKYEG